MIISQCVNAECPQRGIRYSEDDTFEFEDGAVVDMMNVPTLCGECGEPCDKRNENVQ